MISGIAIQKIDKAITGESKLLLKREFESIMIPDRNRLITSFHMGHVSGTSHNTSIAGQRKKLNKTKRPLNIR